MTNLNMDREKFVWSKMWNNVNDLFSEFGCHSNKKIALFIIESLKQLALKFSKVFPSFFTMNNIFKYVKILIYLFTRKKNFLHIIFKKKFYPPSKKFMQSFQVNNQSKFNIIIFKLRTTTSNQGIHSVMPFCFY